MPHGTEVQTANVLSIVLPTSWFSLPASVLFFFALRTFRGNLLKSFSPSVVLLDFSPTQAKKKSSLSFSTVKTLSSGAFSDVSDVKIMDFSLSLSCSLLFQESFCTHFFASLIEEDNNKINHWWIIETNRCLLIWSLNFSVSSQLLIFFSTIKPWDKRDPRHEVDLNALSSAKVCRRTEENSKDSLEGSQFIFGTRIGKDAVAQTRTLRCPVSLLPKCCNDVWW